MLQGIEETKIPVPGTYFIFEKGVFVVHPSAHPWYISFLLSYTHHYHYIFMQSQRQNER